MSIGEHQLLVEELAMCRLELEHVRSNLAASEFAVSLLRIEAGIDPKPRRRLWRRITRRSTT